MGWEVEEMEVNGRSRVPPTSMVTLKDQLTVFDTC